MKLNEQLIRFQNQAEADFNKTKSIKTTSYYLLALAIFFTSTIVAALTFPFRVVRRLIFSSSSTRAVYDMNSENVDQILKTKQPVLIDFWADWCGPCVMMHATVEEFASEFKSVRVVKVNADTNRGLVERFKVKGLPQFVLLQNGREVKRHAGPMTSTDLRRFCLGQEKSVASSAK